MCRVALSTFAAPGPGEGNEVVVAAVITPRPGKTVRKDAALQIFAKRLADIGHWRVVVALAVELACDACRAGDESPLWPGWLEEDALEQCREHTPRLKALARLRSNAARAR